jgi:hypothetical protein
MITTTTGDDARHLAGGAANAQFARSQGALASLEYRGSSSVRAVVASPNPMPLATGPVESTPLAPRELCRERLRGLTDQLLLLLLRENGHALLHRNPHTALGIGLELTRL